MGHDDDKTFFMSPKQVDRLLASLPPTSETMKEMIKKTHRKNEW